MANDNDQSQDEVMEQLKALGYIDPGAGSSVWQAMLARFLRFSSRLSSLFGKKTSEEEDD